MFSGEKYVDAYETFSRLLSKALDKPGVVYVNDIMNKALETYAEEDCDPFTDE